MAPDSSSGTLGYKAALKPTVVTGGSSLVVMLVSMAKSKVVAVILGPSGIGLFGLLNSAVSLVAIVVGMGINSSGARQIAAAVGSKDHNRVARAVFTLRRTSLALGLLGAAVVFIFHEQLALLTIGTAEYGVAVAILSFVVLFRTVGGGQSALLRGMRRIGDLAKLKIVGAVAGTLIAIPCVLLWGMNGVAPAMVAVAGVGTLASWGYARRIRVREVSLSWGEFKNEFSGLFSLGMAFAVTGVLASVAQLTMKTILARGLGLDAVGQFQAAVALSMVYVSFILRAMGLDFLPRLTEVANDDDMTNRLVNEQAEISMLLAGPGILAIVVLAPIVIPLLYSGRFADAVEILRWQCLGVLLRVTTWPVGFTVPARRLVGTFMTIQAFAQCFHVLVFWVLTTLAGLAGAALAMAVLYAVHLPVVLFVVRRETGFRWSSGAREILVSMFASYALLMVAGATLPEPWATAAGTVIVMSAATYSVRELNKRLNTSVLRVAIERLRSTAAGLGRWISGWTDRRG